MTRKFGLMVAAGALALTGCGYTTTYHHHYVTHHHVVVHHVIVHHHVTHHVVVHHVTRPALRRH